MFNWDFNKHLDIKHRKCKKYQHYLKNDDLLWEHMERDHTESTEVQIRTEPQVTTDPVTKDTSCQDC